MSVTQGATNDRRGASVSGISIGKTRKPDRRVSVWEGKARGQKEDCQIDVKGNMRS